MKYYKYTTKVKTQDGKEYDLGNKEYPPTHHHPGMMPCPECFVINAWTEKIGESHAPIVFFGPCCSCSHRIIDHYPLQEVISQNNVYCVVCRSECRMEIVSQL